ALPRSGVPAWRLVDAIVPVVGVGIAIARLGCFLHGCCFGIPCAFPWGVTFPRDSYVYRSHASLGLLSPGAARSAPVHPLQLYFAGAGLLVTATALAVRRRKRFDGEPTLVALLVYSASAAALEFLRGERTARGFWGPLPQLAWVALAMTVATGAALVLAIRSHQRRAAAGGPPARAGAWSCPPIRQRSSNRGLLSRTSVAMSSSRARDRALKRHPSAAGSWP